MALVCHSFIKKKLAVRRQEWLQVGRTGLSEAMVGEHALERLGDNVLRFLAEYLDGPAGAFFALEDYGTVYRRVATYGVPAGGPPRRSRRATGC